MGKGLVRFFQAMSVGLVALAATALPGLAQDALPEPEGPVILTVSGNIAVSNSPEGAEFDRAMLLKLGQSEIVTTTGFTDGAQRFTGVLARRVLERVGAQGTTVVATALNDYVAPIPVEDVERFNVLLALDMNGEPMRVSDKGPIWIVYPRDAHPELADSRFNDRWVWQLRWLRVE